MRLQILTLFAAFATLSAYAITPDDAADAILGRNADYISAVSSMETQNLDADTFGNLPDPEIEGGYMLAPSGEDNRWDVGVSYSMEWPGVYSARRNMGKSLKNENEAELNAFVATKRLEILEKVEEYLYSERKLMLIRSMAAATDSLRLVTEMAVRGNQMSRLDLAKVSLEQGKINASLSSAENEKFKLIGELKVLNGGYDCSALLESIDDVDRRPALYPKENYLSQINRNPEFLKKVADFESATHNVKVAKAEGLPSLKIGYSHEFEDGIHFNGANLGVSIPIFSNRGKTKAAKANASAAELEMSLVSTRLESEVSSLFEQIEALDNALKTPDEIFSSTDYPALLLKALKGGEISVAEYLQERSWFVESHFEYLDLQYQRASAMRLLQSITSSY